MTSNEIDKLEKELSDILDLNKVFTYIEGKNLYHLQKNNQ